jgi:hypothetical protein
VLRKWLLLVLTFVALSGVPANADESKPWVLPHASNWYGYHSGFLSHCYMQADAQGLWGRERQYDAWCANNTRYRSTAPDQQWTDQYPWDHGHQNDRPQNH